jgi:hypothetical protein
MFRFRLAARLGSARKGVKGSMHLVLVPAFRASGLG